MAKKSSVKIGKPVIQQGGGEWMKVELLVGRFAGKIDRVRKEKAESLIKLGKAKKHDKKKGNV